MKHEINGVVTSRSFVWAHYKVVCYYESLTERYSPEGLVGLHVITPSQQFSPTHIAYLCSSNFSPYPFLHTVITPIYTLPGILARRSPTPKRTPAVFTVQCLRMPSWENAATSLPRKKPLRESPRSTEIGARAADDNSIFPSNRGWPSALFFSGDKNRDSGQKKKEKKRRNKLTPVAWCPDNLN